MRVEVVPPAGYELLGSCGERLVVGVGEILQASRIPSGACLEYRKRALATFGDGGRRILVDRDMQPMPQTEDDNWLPEWGLGRRPVRGRAGTF